MKKRLTAGSLLFAVLAIATGPVGAADFSDGPETVVEDDEDLDHFEFTMGFIAGARRYGEESFAHESGGEGLDGVGALVEPFESAPYDNLMVYGLRYDLRLVVSHVRMTVGVDFPFSSFRPAETRDTYRMGGIDREILVQKIRPYELRFGIGGEYTFGRLTPYVDLIGEVDWVDTELSVDGEAVRYDANSFGFSLRAGVRLYLREWFFVTAAGDVGIVGDRFWGAELSLGFSFG